MHVYMYVIMYGQLLYFVQVIMLIKYVFFPRLL